MIFLFFTVLSQCQQRVPIDYSSNLMCHNRANKCTRTIFDNLICWNCEEWIPKLGHEKHMTSFVGHHSNVLCFSLLQRRSAFLI
jgi:hypothetical protein